jgi:hypothetical protein
VKIGIYCPYLPHIPQVLVSQHRNCLAVQVEQQTNCACRWGPSQKPSATTPRHPPLNLKVERLFLKRAAVTQGAHMHACMRVPRWVISGGTTATADGLCRLLWRLLWADQTRKKHQNLVRGRYLGGGEAKMYCSSPQLASTIKTTWYLYGVLRRERKNNHCPCRGSSAKYIRRRRTTLIQFGTQQAAFSPMWSWQNHHAIKGVRSKQARQLEVLNTAERPQITAESWRSALDKTS